MDAVDIHCTAVMPDGTRCNKIVKRGKNHCNIHYDKAQKLRHKYKKVWDIVSAFNLNSSSDTNHLMKTYGALNKAYHARLAHRSYAFVPECWDWGHNYQFELVQTKMDLCEQKLAVMYEKEKVEETPPDKQIVLFKPEIVAPPKPKAPSKKVSKKSKKKRKNKKSKHKPSNDKILDAYIEENEAIREEKTQLCILILNILEKMVGDDYDPLIFFSVLFSMISKLCEGGYFEKDYKPHLCSEPGCKECCDRIYLDRLFCDCGCAYNEDTFVIYMKRQYTCTLKKFCEILLMHKQKILSLINDVKYYYKIFGMEMLFISYELIYVEDKKRIVLRQTPKEKSFRERLFDKYF